MHFRHDVRLVPLIGRASREQALAKETERETIPTVAVVHPLAEKPDEELVLPGSAPMAFFPFAGWKHSFFGDLHAHGKDAVQFYTEQKVIMSRWF